MPAESEYPSLQGEFQRPVLAYEREFGLHRNWWVRDPCIAGLPVSILLNVLSHDQNYAVTQADVRSGLQLGKDAFIRARRVLEKAGFLRAEEYRLPAGTVDAHGNKIGGHRRVRFIVLDPAPHKHSYVAAPAKAQSTASEESGAGPDDGSTVAADSACGQASAENPPRLESGQSDPVDNSELPRNSGGEAWAGNPTQGFPPLKENKSLENQPVNHHPVQTISPAADDGPAAPGSVVVFDPVTDAVLAGITPAVDAVRLRDKLVAGHANLGVINVAAAAVEVLSAPPPDLRDPVAYLAGPILRSPERWPRVITFTAAVSSGCDVDGHKVFADGTELCAKCEQVQSGAAARPGARFERGFIYLPATVAVVSA